MVARGHWTTTRSDSAASLHPVQEVPTVIIVRATAHLERWQTERVAWKPATDPSKLASVLAVPLHQ